MFKKFIYFIFLSTCLLNAVHAGKGSESTLVLSRQSELQLFECVAKQEHRQVSFVDFTEEDVEDETNVASTLKLTDYDPLELVANFLSGKGQLVVNLEFLDKSIFDKIKYHELGVDFEEYSYFQNIINKNNLRTFLDLYNHLSMNVIEGKSYEELFHYIKNLRHLNGGYKKTKTTLSYCEIVSEKIIIEEIKKIFSVIKKEEFCDNELKKQLSELFYQLSQIYSHILDGNCIEVSEDKNITLYFTDKPDGDNKIIFFDVKEFVEARFLCFLNSLIFNKNNEGPLMRLLEVYIYDVEMSEKIVSPLFSIGSKYKLLETQDADVKDFVAKKLNELRDRVRPSALAYKWKGVNKILKALNEPSIESLISLDSETPRDFRKKNDHFGLKKTIFKKKKSIKNVSSLKSSAMVKRISDNYQEDFSDYTCVFKSIEGASYVDSQFEAQLSYVWAWSLSKNQYVSAPYIGQAIYFDAQSNSWVQSTYSE